MSQAAWIVLGALLVGAAAWVLVKRLIRFIKTGGRSACENCPYAGHCRGDCHKE